MKRWTPTPTLACKIWGHKWEPEGAEFYSVYRCVRCYHEGYTDGSLRERIALRWWIWRRRIDDRLRWVRGWLRCRDCGYYFGRHDDINDDKHLPF